MAKNAEKEHYLPSRAISYAYTVAMHFAQQLEINLKAFLYTADYHGWGDPIELNEFQLKRFKDKDEFIDKATCGAIIEKLKQIKLIKNRVALKAFVRACEHRNKLAHAFLSGLNFEKMTKQKETVIIHDLYDITIDLYKALIISRAVRDRAEFSADKAHESLRAFMRDCGDDDYDNPNRHYSTRKRK